MCPQKYTPKTSICCPQFQNSIFYTKGQTRRFIPSTEYPKNYPSQRRGSFLGYSVEGIQTSRLTRGVNYTFWNVGQHIGSFWGVFLGAHGDFFSLRRQEYIFLRFEGWPRPELALFVDFKIQNWARKYFLHVIFADS